MYRQLTSEYKMPDYTVSVLRTNQSSISRNTKFVERFTNRTVLITMLTVFAWHISFRRYIASNVNSCESVRRHLLRANIGRGDMRVHIWLRWRVMSSFPWHRISLTFDRMNDLCIQTIYCGEQMLEPETEKKTLKPDAKKSKCIVRSPSNSLKTSDP